MRYLIGLSLLMFLLTMTACTKRNPAGTGGTRPATTLTQKEVDERHAENFLSAAKDHKKNGQPRLAVRALNELLEMYPESDAADEATQILADLEELQAETGLPE